MQIFIPYPNLLKSILCLDDIRLNKQIIEAYQIYNIIKHLKNNPDVKIGHSKHPVVTMWIRNIKAVKLYHDLCLTEWIDREKNNDFSKPSRKYLLSKNVDISKIKLPIWFGNKKVHASHRSRLLFKGSIDAVVKTLEKKLGRYSTWREEHQLPKKNQLTIQDRKYLYTLVKQHKLKLQDNYYQQFNWKESDNIPYVWIR